LLNVTDSNAIALKAIEHSVIFVPGKYMMMADPDQKTPYIRIAYSIPTEEQMNIVS